MDKRSHTDQLFSELPGQSAQSCQQGIGFHAAAGVAPDHGTIEHSSHLGSITSILWRSSHGYYLDFCKSWPSGFFQFSASRTTIGCRTSIGRRMDCWTFIYFINFPDLQSVTITVDIMCKKVTRLNRHFQARIENPPTISRRFMYRTFWQ